jgi:hypothetical protein
MTDNSEQDSGWRGSLGWLAAGILIVLAAAGVFVFG